MKPVQIKQAGLLHVFLVQLGDAVHDQAAGYLFDLLPGGEGGEQYFGDLSRGDSTLGVLVKDGIKVLNCLPTHHPRWWRWRV